MDNFHRLLKWQTLYNADFPMILHWRNKAGCTSLCKWFFFQIGLLETALEHSPWIHNYRALYQAKNKNYYYNKADIIEEKHFNKADIANKKHYKLVRNPYSRAVSSYIAMLTMLVSPSEYNIVIPNSDKGMSFKQFLYYINKVGSSINVIEQHFAQQYIEDEENFVNNYIYLENLEKDLRYLEKTYSLTHSPLKKFVLSPHHNPKNKKNYEISLADTAFKSLAELHQDFPSFPLYNNFYDNETEQLVKKIFHKDFDTYKYPVVLPDKLE